MSQLKSIIKKYRTLTQNPAILTAKFMQNASIINSVWSRRNIELGKSTKSFVSFNINEQLNVVGQSVTLDISNELISKVSPSGKYRAVIRECDTKDGQRQYLEIWERVILTHCVDLNAADEHLDVYTDGEFGSLEWSPDESKLIYIAEKKSVKSEAYYKRKRKSEDNDTIQGKEYLYKQDWGEQLVSKKQSVIAMYNLSEDSVHILDGIPENVCPAQVIWGAEGKSVIGMALKTDSRKLGLIYCTNRLSTIFSLDLQGNYAEINLTKKSVKSPVLTLDGLELIWLQRDAGGPHAATMSLVKTTLPISENSKVQTVVDIVQTEQKITGDKVFYGLYTNKLPNRCWATERRLLLSTNQRYYLNSYVIDIDSGNITELPCENNSLIVLDVSNDLVLAAQRNFLVPDVLVVGKLPSKGNEMSIEWKNVTESNLIDGADNFICHNLDIEQDTAEDVTKFTAIYLGPKSAPENSVPLIIWPHGGPHSAFASGYSLEASLFMQMGYGILLINYRGSIGAGEKCVNFLLGRVGKSDVADCITAAKEALRKFDWLTSEKLVLVGGSHGGFLVTHLSGQYPTMFKVVIARNPVIDFASLNTISDIPDWCFVEAGSEYTQVGEPDNELLLKMRKLSPIQHAHKVKAATLLQIGSKDLRVPAYQAIDYYHRLKANKIPVEMNLYEDNHPLDSVPNEMNNVISSLLWIEKYVHNSLIYNFVSFD